MRQAFIIDLVWCIAILLSGVLGVMCGAQP